MQRYLSGNRSRFLLGLLDSIPMAIALLDTQRRIFFLNRGFERMTGWDRSRLEGLHCFHILRQKICINDCPALREGSEECYLESDLITTFRKKIPVRVTFSRILGEKGQLVGFMECLEDQSRLVGANEGWDRTYRFANIIGKSPGMEHIFRLLPLIAETDSSVLITGETGTGKDLIAEAIHMASPRAKGPFIKVNCGAVPETLLESELFGHEKGAFTGATESKPGRFRLAHNGTLYLTEIGDLPPPLQVKLLTFLDDKVIYPLGGSKGIKVDVRIIAGTHRDLEAMVRENKFRQDLLFRLNVLRIHLPPLRERGEDKRLLLDYFVQQLGSQLKKEIHGVDEDVWRVIDSYDFPGNVRELKNILEYAATISNEGRISLRHLPRYILEYNAPKRPEGPEGESGLKLAATEKGIDAASWSDAERKLILDALVLARGKKGKAAALLGWGRSTLWRKMRQYDLY